MDTAESDAPSTPESLPHVATSIIQTHKFKTKVQSRLRRKMGWTRKQALLEQLSRQCQDHLEHHGTLPVIPVDIKVDSLRRAIRRRLTFASEWSSPPTTLPHNSSTRRTEYFYTKFSSSRRSPISFFAMGEPDGHAFLELLHAHAQASVAVLYGKLLTKVHNVTLPTGAADEFLDFFPYLVSRTVYKVAQKAYPEFLFQLRRLARQPLIRTTCVWTTGILAKSSCWKTWRVEIKKKKLKHAPKPHLMVRELADDDRSVAEDFGSDDSNEEDSLSDEDAAFSSVACAEFKTEAAASENATSAVEALRRMDIPQRKYAHGHLEKADLAFSAPVRAIMDKYSYSGLQGRRLGVALRLSDKEHQTYNMHKEQHKAWLDHLSRPLRQTQSLSSLTLEAANEDKQVFAPRCEFELTNPVAEARAKRLLEAKQKILKREQEYVGEVIQYKPAIIVFGQRLDQHLKMNPLRRKAILAPLKS
ncbi:hypothetical protein SPRG_03359 [Saprolegnia parasitica CBS 223.65]|uniref:Uncharacterized protein n=1 Tax=Saprolegnia parasitica (strain CBS 223.65) TaxID=695850 RepID=A0A067CZC6_SAPPC|nr:hypothetical protein SPRG_03359 [Saprolegnia parasitica CBS 223.65]KDO32142.1 hypothetical protein SPRG_03359 [Saprolegnia parasitica CBS 223.65]|eukprot:XP_012197326.1 hypothetical protein SPRG_03359 [Saprolegnia parasitica CBS 223.65]